MQRSDTTKDCKVDMMCEEKMKKEVERERSERPGLQRGTRVTLLHSFCVGWRVR